MSSIRLTNEMRNRICKAVLEHRFAAEEAALEKAKEEIAEFSYSILYTPARLERFKGSEPGEYVTLDFMNVSFAGQSSVRFCLNGGPRPFFHAHNSYTKTIRFAADDPPAQAWEKYQAKKSKFREAKDTAEAKVNGILSEATTVKKLIEIWPEVEPFIPPGTTPVHLPAVPRVEVNALLGLPTKKED